MAIIYKHTLDIISPQSYIYVAPIIIIIQDIDIIMDTKPCVVCQKQLKSTTPDRDWSTLQPHGGGEIKLVFSYGSCKFDLNMYNTEFVGIICDECAEPLTERMLLITNKHVDLG